MKRRILPVLLALAMVLSLLPVTALAADFIDTDGHWAEASIDRWADEDVIHGYDDRTFSPNGFMTRAQAAQTFANLFRLTERTDVSVFPDISLDAWYVDAISKCVAAGILQGTDNGTMNPEGHLTREQLFTMLGRALGIAGEATSEITFDDSDEISDWATGYINAMVNMGAINGMGDNILAPGDNINRASVMTVMDRMIGSYITSDGTYAAPESGIILIVGGESVTITGDIDSEYIAIVEDGVEVVLAKATGVPEIAVKANNVVIIGAAEGTHITTGEDSNLSVNGTVLSESEIADGEYTVPGATEPEPSKPSSSNKPSTPSTKYYTVTFYANYPTEDPNGNCQGADPEDSTPPDGDPNGNCTNPDETDSPDGNCNSGSGTTTPEKPGNNCEDTNPSTPPEKGEEEAYATVKDVKSGTTLKGKMPANPKAPEGYKFVGWATTKDAKAPDFDDSTKVTKNLSIYAIWTEDADNNCGGGPETPNKPDGDGDNTEDPDNNCGKDDQTPPTDTEGNETTGGADAETPKDGDVSEGTTTPEETESTEEAAE